MPTRTVSKMKNKNDSKQKIVRVNQLKAKIAWKKKMIFSDQNWIQNMVERLNEERFKLAALEKQLEDYVRGR